MSAIKLENLTHTYSAGTPFETVAIDNINLEIPVGEFTGIIGHTGSGKSTLVTHLNGLIKPTSGKVFVGGEDIWQDPKQVRKYRFKVGLVFQYPEYQLFEETVFKDIAFGPRNMGLSPDEITLRVREAAAFAGLDESVLEKSPFELSGGQKRRAAIAGVFAMRPEIIVLDEPTAGLDPKGREMLLERISDYHKKTGSTVLLVSHSMEDIARFAQKVVVMNNAGVYMYDTPARVFRHADKLEEMGLDVPQISKLFAELIRRGYDLPGDIYTVEGAKRAIAALLEKRGVSRV